MTNGETTSAAPYAVDLTNCDREPIHHINAIQPVGFLVAVSSDWLVLHVSANTPDFLARPFEALLDIPLRDILRPDALHLIHNQLAVLSGPDGVEHSFAVQLQDDGPLYDLAIYRTGQLVVIEAEPSQAAGTVKASAMVRTMLARMKGQADPMREAARLMQVLTGFDRVMIYRFHPDGSGEVIAERARRGLEPYLGLRYPASDIPQQARALLIRNPVRMLVDVNAEPSALVPSQNAFSAPLDLSMSTLRAHSTMCILYLQNMGVGATLTVSLVRDGRLWGMISCHHMAARHLGFEERATAELFGEIMSLLIEKRERADVSAYEAHIQQRRQQLIVRVIERGSDLYSVPELAAHLADLVPCGGFAIYADGGVTRKGQTPTASACATLRGFLDEQPAGQIFATAELGRLFAPAQAYVEQAAGILVLPISRTTRDYLVFFRPEQAFTVTWAGRPGKQSVASPDGPRLLPRKSFDAWRETVRGHSEQWTPAELAAAEMMRVTLLEIALQQAGKAETENQEMAQKQELLIAELNHRVRNILGLIRSLVTQSRLSAQDVDTFAAILGDRIHALARAHDQITARNWGPSSLASLLKTEAAAYLGEGAPRVSFDGPITMLTPQAFQTMALVIHELMTNAAKHGALASGQGHVAITWRLDEAGDLILHWHETGGTPVVTPTRRGFGSTIIHRSIPHELGGEATLDYAPEGLCARFVIPAAHAVRSNEPALALVESDEADADARLTGTVLLVEDNMIIALESEDLLLTLGAESVLVASTVAEALRLVEMETPTFALLDINLGTEMSWPVALRLRELGVRYAFATGYGNS
ncbi:MAG: GAF domain-containing protein, partial [Pseudomonadota bacterium]|nr:GAF domain-containing protein [Pseudomonadota bacterium]